MLPLLHLLLFLLSKDEDSEIKITVTAEDKSYLEYQLKRKEMEKVDNDITSDEITK